MGTMGTKQNTVLVFFGSFVSFVSFVPFVPFVSFVSFVFGAGA